MEGTPAEQAQQLKAEYEKKLAEINAPSLEVSENSSETTDSLEHQAISETTEQMIKEHVPDFKASSHSQHDSNDIAPENQAKVQEWVNVAITNPVAGVKMARNSNDIGLIDIFHKVLTSNEMYKAIVQRGEIPELK
ncbi:MAG: hypothetical protein KBC81_01675 [Candidatus Pacebacteria bacterium]|nr:hypothetical protein [Candidatus Paceibacterota bacterium]